MTEQDLAKQFAERLSRQFESLSSDVPERTAERGEERQEYSITRYIAPWDGTTAPDAARFGAICCHDLSKSGLSFWIDQPPEFDYYLVRLEMSSEVAYVKARVVRVDREPDPSRPDYLVGCAFEGRIGAE